MFYSNFSIHEYMIISAVILWMLFTMTFITAQITNIWVIMDTVWGIGFSIIVFTGWLLSGVMWNIKMIPVLLVLIWGTRLSIHLRKRAKQEDPRYEALKGGHWFGAYIKVFLLQGLLTWIMCIPFYFYIPKMSLIDDLPNTILLFVGLFICIWGLFWEWTADYQLKRHISKKDSPKGLMKTGLWSLTRHPNYFGEISFWWGIWIICLNQGSFLSIIVSIVSPLTITLIISKVTGPMLEKLMEKYEEWTEYSRNVPYIIPKFLTFKK